MNIAICDDDNTWITHIEEYVSRIKKVYKETEYDTFESGEALLKYYEMHGNVFDIVILDIEMANMSGIEAAQKIREKDTNVCIFFLTGHKEYVYDCFRPSPMNFWIKPLEYELFKEDIMRAYQRINDSNVYIKIIENRQKIRLKCDDIIYIENKDRKSWIHTVQGVYKTNKLLSELISELDDKFFVRVYKSFIINLKYIHVIAENTLELYDTDDLIPISRTYKRGLENKYISLKERENF